MTLCALALLFLADPAGAQEANDTGGLHASKASGEVSRSWDLGAWAAVATGEENTNSFGEAQILTTGLFVGKMLTGERGRGWRRGSLEFGCDIFPVFAQIRPARIYGAGFEPILLRWNSSLKSGRAHPFIELGGGAIQTHGSFPRGDTSSFNFIARGGGGLQIATRSRQSLDLGVRWWHISNANLGARNPEFNGIQVSVGWHWYR